MLLLDRETIGKMHHWHIVYLSFETGQTGKDYIGKHSTKNLHDGYLGSYHDPSFHPNSRIILGYYKTAQAAIDAEIQWQKVFQVATDPRFVNQVYQTSSKFDPGNRKWFFDPATNREVYLESCPEGFLPGRPSLKDPEKVLKRLKNRVCASGEKNGRCKLTLDQIPKIMDMKKSKQFTVQEIARMFGVSPATIRRVTNNPNYWCNR